MGEPSFFDVDDRLRCLSDLGDQLEAFGRAVDFESLANTRPSRQAEFDQVGRALDVDRDRWMT
jgi:hypothetical protein